MTIARVRLSRHALDRFVERFAVRAGGGRPDELRPLALARTRRLCRNPENGAIAVLAIYQGPLRSWPSFRKPPA